MLCSRNGEFVCLLVWFLGVFNDVGKGEQSFRVKPVPEVSAVEGQESLILECAVNDQVGDLQWTWNGLGLGFDPSLPGYTRYSMIIDESIGQSNLRISPVLLEDDGDWECQVSPGDVSLRANSHVTVLVPPKPPSIRKPSEVTAGTEATLTCQSNLGNPSAQITWYKGGTELTNTQETTVPVGKLFNSTNVLTIQPTRDDNAVSFFCQANNVALTEPYIIETKLNVLYSPEVRIKLSEDTLKADNAVKLNCSVDANPPQLTYMWTYGGKAVSGATQRTLEVSQLLPDHHQGIFTCMATNSIGTGNASVTLNVQYLSEVMVSPAEAEANLRDMTEFSCAANGNPNPFITWTKHGSHKILSRSSLLEINNVTASDAGIYICTASVPGFSDITASAVLYLKSIPQLASNPSQGAALGSDTELECFTNSRPLPDSIVWSWDRESLSAGQESGRHSVSEVRLHGGIKSILSIESVKSEDYRDYNCTVTNELGSAHQIVHLSQKETISLAMVIGITILIACLMILCGIVVVVLQRRRAYRKKEISSKSADAIRAAVEVPGSKNTYKNYDLTTGNIISAKPVGDPMYLDSDDSSEDDSSIESQIYAGPHYSLPNGNGTLQARSGKGSGRHSNASPSNSAAACIILSEEGKVATIV